MRPKYYDDVEGEKLVFSGERAREMLKEWERKTYRIECPLPNGVLLWRTYWRDGGGKVCEGVTIPRASDGADPWDSRPPHHC